MKKLFCSLLLAQLVGAGPALAQKVPLEVEVQIVRVRAGGPAGARIFSAEEYRRLLEGHQLQVLESQTVLTEMGADSLVQMGGKIPMTYRDPRADAFQVQYIDTGFRTDVKVAEAANGHMLIQCVLGRTSLTGEGGAMASSDAFRGESNLLLRPSEAAAVLATRGRMTARYLKSIYPQANLTETDTVELVLSVRKL